MTRFKSFLTLVLAAALALLPFTEQAEIATNPTPPPNCVFPPPDQLAAFQARCAQNLASNNWAALLTDFRQTYQVPSWDGISMTVSADGPAPDDYGAPSGCIFLVVVIAVVLWGVIVYITYQICTQPPPSNSNTNSPPSTNSPPVTKEPPPILN